MAIEASERDDEEKTLTTKRCSKGSKRDHKRSRDYKLDRESTEMKVQLEVMKEIIQRNVEDQVYGWILQKKRVKWSLLQGRLRHMTSAQLKEELRRVEL